jgi:hypothetical protein
LFLPTNKSANKDPLKNPTKAAPTKKITANVPTKKLTKVQSERLRVLLAKSPAIEKLHPEIYAKLQSTIHEVVEKTMPEYKKWLNSAFGERVIAEDCPVEICSSCGNDCPVEICSSCGNDCPVEICSSCGNDCPTPVGHIVDRVTNEAISAAMTAAIRFALAEAMSKQSGKEVSEAKMRTAVKEQLIKVAKEIGKGK